MGGSDGSGGVEVWVVRHGETEWSRDGLHTSRTELSLTPVGEDSAKALRRRLAGEHFDLVLTSPRERARRTCELAGFAGEAEVEPGLVEWDYGVYEGRSTAEIRETEPGWSVWTHPMPQGETLDEVAARADAVIDRLQGSDGRALLFSHGHFLRILAARWLCQPAALGKHLVLHTGTVSALGWERDVPALQSWND